jgi:hypothetical protein
MVQHWRTRRRRGYHDYERMPSSASADARIQHCWINTTKMIYLWRMRRRKGYFDWILREIKSIGSVTIATRELHGMKNTIAGERYFYTRDGRILLHLF